MPFEVTEKNADALKPLFRPWEEPNRHRLPNPVPGGPAKSIVMPLLAVSFLPTPHFSNTWGRPRTVATISRRRASWSSGRMMSSQV